MATSVIVDHVKALGGGPPDVEPWVWSPAEAASGINVSFRTGSTGSIDSADPLGELWWARLRSSRNLGVPAYAELDDHRITRVLLPMQTRVRRVIGLSSTRFRVRLEGSNLRHTITLAGASEAARLATLRQAAAAGTALVVTHDPETHAIIDVRESAGVFDRQSRRCLTRGQAIALATGISASRARDLFDAIASRICTLPLPGPSNLGDGLPFQIPDNRCWAIAHVVARELRKLGVVTGKAFVFDTDERGPGLRIATRNRSDCEQVWDWHVVPFVRVMTHGGDRAMVFDHVSFLDEGPIEAVAWKTRLGGRSAALDLTEDWVYKQTRPCEPFPERAFPAGIEDEEVVASREDLWERSRGRQSPPPYAGCSQA